jgi:aminoglycoside 3-N-acetyltransferase
MLGAVLEPPVTTPDLVRDLRALGVRPGEVLLVHTSLRALSGPRSMVVGGAVAVVDALVNALGEAGTVVMPTFSSYLSDPSRWTHPPAPTSWWPAVRMHLPPYRPDATPTHGVGTVPEVFRKMTSVLRSHHPQASFAAHGPSAPEVLEPHPLEDALGDGSPLGRLHRMDARVLMLGAPWRSCTAFHLGELRATPEPTRVHQGAPILDGGRRRWAEWSEPNLTVDGFGAVGEAFEGAGHVVTGSVGRATARLFAIRAAVDCARELLPRVR